MWVSTRPEPVRKAPKVYLVYLIKNSDHALLNDFVFQRRDPDWTLPPIGLRYVYSSRGLSPIGSPMHTTVQYRSASRPSTPVSYSRHVTSSTPGAACRFNA